MSAVSPGYLIAALQQEPGHFLNEQGHAAGGSVTPSITSVGSACRAASSPTMCRTCARSSGAKEIVL
jgi:hypothetical protein